MADVNEYLSSSIGGYVELAALNPAHTNEIFSLEQINREKSDNHEKYRFAEYSLEKTNSK